VAVPAARLVLLGSPHDDRLAGVRRCPTVDEPLRRRRRAAAAVAHGLELVHELGIGEQVGMGPKGSRRKSWSRPAAMTREPPSASKRATSAITRSKNCTSSIPTTSKPRARASSSATDETGTAGMRRPAWLTTSKASKRSSMCGLKMTTR
jgi:hypothetical protein